MSTEKKEGKEFDDLVKPAPPLVANPISPPSSQILESRGKEWDAFLGQVNDNYIKTLRSYAPKNEFEIEIDGHSKTYTRRKIKTRDYAELEKIRAQFAKANTNGDIEKASDLQFQIYIKCAESYLGMTREEFDEADFEEVKKVCDACNFRTLHGLPN